jgi:hypothetical protein
LPDGPWENMANALKNMAFIWQKLFENMAFIWHSLFHEKQYNKIFIFLSNTFHCLLRLEANHLVEKIVKN